MWIGLAWVGCSCQPEPSPSVGVHSGGAEPTGDTAAPTGPTGDTGTGVPVVNAVRWLGDEAGATAGQAIDVGNADGDDLAEALLGAPAPTHPGELYQRETAHLVAGSSVPGSLAQHDVLTFGGEQHGVGAHIGHHLALPGDLTGDGEPDAVLSANYDPNAGIYWCVFSTSSLGGPEVHYEDAASCIVDVDRDNDLHTDDIAGCGDLDGDTLPDLCMGLAGIEDGALFGLVVLHGPLPPNVSWEDEADFVQTYEISPGDHLAGGVDLTGDGRNDVLVAGPNAFEGSPGGIWLVTEVPPGTTSLDDHPVWVGDEVEADLGDSVVTGGDLDGDGLADAFLGAHTSHDRQGRGYVATDKDGGPAVDSFATFVGGELDWMGASAALADFDADGHDDFAVGVPGDIYFDEPGRPGRVAVYRGPVAPGIHAEVDADVVYRASDAQDGFGLRMDAGDMDGDGRADLVVAALADDTAAPDAGAVYLVWGGGLP